MIVRDLTCIHPLAWAAFTQLARSLDQQTDFRPFETYRTPERQAELLQKHATKAAPWHSAHQYGLAVDFVPFRLGKWTWDVPISTWDILRRLAKDCGLKCELDWDRAHVEHPIFAERVHPAMFRP